MKNVGGGDTANKQYQESKKGEGKVHLYRTVSRIHLPSGTVVSPGCSPSPRWRNLACSHTVTRSPSLPFLMFTAHAIHINTSTTTCSPLHQTPDHSTGSQHGPTWHAKANTGLRFAEQSISSLYARVVGIVKVAARFRESDVHRLVDHLERVLQLRVQLTNVVTANTANQ